MDKRMIIFLVVGSIFWNLSSARPSLPLLNPGGIGGVYKGPNSETIIHGPDGSIITSAQEGGAVVAPLVEDAPPKIVPVIPVSQEVLPLEPIVKVPIVVATDEPSTKLEGPSGTVITKGQSSIVAGPASTTITGSADSPSIETLPISASATNLIPISPSNIPEFAPQPSILSIPQQPILPVVDPATQNTALSSAILSNNGLASTSAISSSVSSIAKATASPLGSSASILLPDGGVISSSASSVSLIPNIITPQAELQGTILIPSTPIEVQPQVQPGVININPESIPTIITPINGDITLGRVEEVKNINFSPSLPVLPSETVSIANNHPVQPIIQNLEPPQTILTQNEQQFIIPSSTISPQIGTVSSINVDPVSHLTVPQTIIDVTPKSSQVFIKEPTILGGIQNTGQLDIVQNPQQLVPQEILHASPQLQVDPKLLNAFSTHPLGLLPQDALHEYWSRIGRDAKEKKGKKV